MKISNSYSGLVAKPPYFMTLPLQPQTSAPALALSLMGRLLKSCQSESTLSGLSQAVYFCKGKAPRDSVTSYFGIVIWGFIWFLQGYHTHPLKSTYMSDLGM